MHFVTILNHSMFLLLNLSKNPCFGKEVCYNEICTRRLSKIYHTASKYRMSLVDFNGTNYNKCIIFNNPHRKRKLRKENYSFRAKYEGRTLFKMSERFRIRIQPKMLRTLWYFRHQYFQRTSNMDLVGRFQWNWCSGTRAQKISLLRCSQQYHPGISLWYSIDFLISKCENSFHFWRSGQWPVSGHLRSSGWAGISPRVSYLQWYGRPQNFVPSVNSFLGSHNYEEVTGKLISTAVNANFLCRWTSDFSESCFFTHSFSSLGLFI